MDRVLTDAERLLIVEAEMQEYWEGAYAGSNEAHDRLDHFSKNIESAILAKLADRLKDADRWKEVWSHGLPFTFLGVEYHDKESCDAAIDQARRN